MLDGLGGDKAVELVGALRFGGTIVTYGSLGGGPSQVSNAVLLTREDLDSAAFQEQRSYVNFPWGEFQ